MWGCSTCRSLARQTAFSRKEELFSFRGKLKQRYLKEREQRLLDLNDAQQLVRRLQKEEELSTVRETNSIGCFDVLLDENEQYLLDNFIINDDNTQENASCSLDASAMLSSESRMCLRFQFTS